MDKLLVANTLQLENAEDILSDLQIDDPGVGKFRPNSGGKSASGAKRSTPSNSLAVSPRMNSEAVTAEEEKQPSAPAMSKRPMSAGLKRGGIGGNNNGADNMSRRRPESAKTVATAAAPKADAGAAAAEAKKERVRKLLYFYEQAQEQKEKEKETAVQDASTECVPKAREEELLRIIEELRSQVCLRPFASVPAAQSVEFAAMSTHTLPYKL